MLINSFYTINNIMQTDEKKYAVSITLNPQHIIYQGHFPGNPVVPGVCMQQIVKEVLSVIIEEDLVLSKADNIKFINMIIPHNNSNLKVNITIKSNEKDMIKTDSQIVDDHTVYFKYIACFSKPIYGE